MRRGVREKMDEMERGCTLPPVRRGFCGKGRCALGCHLLQLGMRMGARGAIRCRVTKVRRCDPRRAGQRTKKQEGTMSSKLVAYFSATGMMGEVAKTL